jgi:peroxiredoxin
MKIKFVSLLAALVATLFVYAAPPAGYTVGDKARDFKLKNVDGKTISLADYKDAKGYIVTFTCNHCPFAIKYEDRIIDLHNKYAAKGYPVVAINPNDKDRSPDDSFEKMIVRAKEKKFPFAYLYDESQEIAKAYGATRTPHIYILSKKGNDLTVEYIGAIDDNTDDPTAVQTKYVENALDNLLAGKKADPGFTKAVGCTIKWKATE